MCSTLMWMRRMLHILNDFPSIDIANLFMFRLELVMSVVAFSGAIIFASAIKL